MDNGDIVPWYTVLRRLIPYAILWILLRLSWLMVLIGFGRAEARRFYRDTIE
ncbi:hypothetical protein [Pseudosulfitobacter pseudonitzschiae]|uniref:hypothetical protein n=1 Tax=Pseudosulfitobacter pseudonitzschiae TaxID=1402135 RepID=UPI003B7E2DC7